MLLRYANAVLLGTVATFGLLMLMRAVIADPMPAQDDGIKGELVDFVLLVKDREPAIKDRKPEPPPPPEREPDRPPRDDLTDGVGTPMEGWRAPEPLPPDGGLDGAYMDDGTYLPIVRVQPVYPRRALARNIEGWVLVEFVVTETGTVRDPVVLVADPPGFFERAALSAVVKFKYKPRIDGGVPVAVSGVRNRFVFEMED